jgi:hypothetical protein
VLIKEPEAKIEIKEYLFYEVITLKLIQGLVDNEDR